MKKNLKKKLSILALTACLGVAGLGLFSSINGEIQQGSSVTSHFKLSSITVIHFVKSGKVSP